MNLENEIWVLDENKISQTFNNKNEIQKPEGGLIEQVIKEEHDENDGRMLVLRGDDIIRIDDFPFIIGKSQRVDFTIQGDSFVSRKHCRITKKNNKYYIEDLDSMNGTKVDGREVSSKTEIREGSRITIADREYTVRWES